MTSKTYLYSHSPNSQGAIALSAALQIKRIRHQDSTFRGSRDKLVINWGSSRLPIQVLQGCKIINQPDKIAIAANKLAFFRAMYSGLDQPRVPAWTDNPETAKKWLSSGFTTVARTLLESHSGRGIVILEKGDDFVDAPLYTLFVNGKDEYRVHIVNGKVIDVQRKARRANFEGEANPRIRSLDNGYVYTRQDVVPPEDVLIQAMKAYKILGLDFGAFDVRYLLKEDRAYVLECNTAPGLEGTTVENYKKAFEEYV